MITYTKTVPTLLDTDVIVVGSGSAGASAAIASARAGARTVLVERLSFLGGTSTAVLDTFYGYYTPGKESKKVVGGIPDDVVRELGAFGAAFERPNTFGAGTGVTYDPELLKVVWERLALAAGVRLLLNSFCTDVVMEEGRVAGIIVDGKRGLMHLSARVVVDCTGDADVCARAGAPYERAGDIDPAQTLSTTFRMVNVDVERAQGFGKKEMWAKMTEAADSGLYRLPRREGSWHVTTQAGVIHTIMTRVADVDGTDPEALTEAEVEGRAQALEYARFLRDHVPGFERAQLSWLSSPIGVRETRRVYGEYRLTREDCLSARKFSDAIGACGAPIEDHHAGTDTKWLYVPEGETYDIPYRTLVPRQVRGLLVAGRCFSATHDAHASCRSMAQTMTMGQAAGSAAALSVKGDTLPHELFVPTLQDHLLGLGAKFGDLSAVTA
ncbi:membrane protein (plasmid) [Deinococcus aetherius]|uniref:Membrane protein n=1 Tax=Deinococcus aetherius TaxID=200252 RepID=A0ABM8AJ30_9DEIO|nr:FAD-dependent oxidoreductase [Deinococcus aetherius]BDP43717.1 membrane protein [Deinococcus aetherius]